MESYVADDKEGKEREETEKKYHGKRSKKNTNDTLNSS